MLMSAGQLNSTHLTRFYFIVPDNQVRFTTFDFYSCFYWQIPPVLHITFRVNKFICWYSIMHLDANFMVFVHAHFSLLHHAWRHSAVTIYYMKHILNLIFAQSAMIIGMHSNFVTLTYEVFCAYFLFLNSTGICFKVRCHVFVTGLLFTFQLIYFLQLRYIFAYISVQWLLQILSVHKL